MLSAGGPNDRHCEAGCEGSGCCRCRARWGVHPESNEPIISQNGRFGPYIKCGTDTRSLPAGVSPIEVTLSEALELFAQPKVARRGFGAPKEPLRTLEASPTTGQPIKLLEGRYGFYVTDGVTNAPIPKETKPEELTLPQALDLIAIRAAAGLKTRLP